MIKPATLWAMFKTCEDSSWLGDICRSLGGQDVPLDFGQRQMVNAIRLDSGWMDEIMKTKQAQWRERQAAKRARDAAAKKASNDVGTQESRQQPASIPSLVNDGNDALALAVDKFKAALDNDQSGAPFFDPEVDAVVACVYLTGDRRSVRRWRQAVEEIGEDVFRQELFSFYREIQVGEDPANRGAALNARLKKIASKGG